MNFTLILLFLLRSLLYLSMSIIKSTVVAGLFFGFVSKLTVGPSYLFLLRARVMKEGTEREVAATTGFVMGHLMMFISMYYGPLHYALGHPYGATIIVVPYFLFHYFWWNNYKHFFIDHAYLSTDKNAILAVQCAFLNNLISALLNVYVLPSAALERLLHVEMFQSSNKVLFVTSSFVGWMLGHILFIKFVKFLVFWIQEKTPIRTKNFLWRELRFRLYQLGHLLGRFFSIVLFTTCVYQLGRMPVPFLTRKQIPAKKEETDPTKLLKNSRNLELKAKEAEEKTKEEEEKNRKNEEKNRKNEEKNGKNDDDDDEDNGENEENQGKNEDNEGNGKNEDEMTIKVPRWRYNFEKDIVESDGEQEIRKKRSYNFEKDIAAFEAVEEELLKQKWWAYNKLSKFTKDRAAESEGLEGEEENNEEEKKEKKEKKEDLEKRFLTSLFDYQRRNRPLRYIKTQSFDNAVRNEMSQYFFYTCPSDGKEKISFTYPPSLYTFSKMIEEKMSLYTTEKVFGENKDLYNSWVYTNEQTKHNLNNELINRIKAIQKQMGCLVLDVLEKRIRLYNDDENEEAYLPKEYDPFLNGPYRGNRREDSRNTEDSITEDSRNTEDSITQDSIETIWINRIHSLLANDSREFEDQQNPFVDKEALSTDIANDRVASIPPTDEFSEEEIDEFSEEISKEVPRWRYKLTADIEELKKGKEEKKKEEEEEEKLAGEDIDKAEKRKKKKMKNNREIRSIKAKRVIIFNDRMKKEIERIRNKAKGKDKEKEKDQANEPEEEELAFLWYPQRPYFARDLIKGSMRAQRRKTVTWKMFQRSPHSPLFADQTAKPFFFSFGFDFSKMMNRLFRNWVGRESKIGNLDSVDEEARDSLKRQAEEERIRISELWDKIFYAQRIRGLALLTQSFLRKSIKLPFLIITKNIGRMLLFQYPEWHEDWGALNREMHVKCTYNAIPLSETEFPEDWLTDGIQIKIVFPFRLKPWQGAKLGGQRWNKEEEEFGFLTIWGEEAEVHFGPPRKLPSFFEPIFDELTNKYLRVANVLKSKIKPFISTFNEKTEGLQKAMRKELEKRDLIGLSELNENELNEKNAISNQNTEEFLIQMESENWTKNLLLEIEKEIQDRIDRRIKTRNQIERIQNEKKKVTQEINILSPNNTNWNEKKPKLWKKILPIFKKRSIRFIRKLHYFTKSFIEKLYMDLFLYIIKILRINIELLVESINKRIQKFIYSREKRNQEEIDSRERNKNMIPFSLTIKNGFSNSFYNTNYSYSHLSSLSQAYVFYKIAQTQFSNKYHLRPVLQYHGTRLFLKDQIKNYCETQGIFDPKRKQNPMEKSIINEWKNWLKGHYQYNVSHTEWSKLVAISKECKKKVKERCTIQNKDSRKLDSYKKEKKSLIPSLIKEYSQVDSLMSQKAKFKKNCRYDLLLDKYLSHTYRNYEKRGDSYIYGSPFKVNRNQEILSNLNIEKPQSVYVRIDVDISDCIKRLSRRLENPPIFDFFIKQKYQKINIDTWNSMVLDLGIGRNMNQNTKTQMNIDQNLDNKEEKRKLSEANQKRHFFDWMGMNQEKVDSLYPKCPLFPEFGLNDTYNAYQKKPWPITRPSELLLDFDENQDISQNQNINGNTEKDIHISSKKKEDLELEKKKQEKKQESSQVDFLLAVQKQKKKTDIEENSKDANSKDIKENSKGSDEKSKTSEKERDQKEALQIFLKKHFLFLPFQIKLAERLSEKMMDNVKVACVMLRLLDLKEMARKAIRKGELNADLFGDEEEDINLNELLKEGLLFIEPLPRFPKWDEKKIMYQMIGIALVNKSQYQTNNESINKKDVDKNDFQKSIAQGYNILNENPNSYDFLVPEHLLSTRQRRKLRILNCLNSQNQNVLNEILVFGNENNVKGRGQFRNEDSYPHINTNKLIKLFIWPNFRLEDLACMNRYWFNTNNGSRFTMSRIHMYPRFPIN
nr:Ycf1 [Caldesia parnassifolia]QII68556.1 Ycf1 [Caldesia parnassifolia]